MALYSISSSLSSSLPMVTFSPSSSSTTIWKPPVSVFMPPSLSKSNGICLRGSGNQSKSLQVVRMAPDEEKMTRRSPLDFPIEWERPKPGRRPDIFPQFSPMKTPIPPPMPGDPPEEDEEEEEKKEEEEENPEEEDQPKPEQLF